MVKSNPTLPQGQELPKEGGVLQSVSRIFRDVLCHFIGFQERHRDIQGLPRVFQWISRLFGALQGICKGLGSSQWVSRCFNRFRGVPGEFPQISKGYKRISEGLHERFRVAVSRMFLGVSGAFMSFLQSFRGMESPGRFERHFQSLQVDLLFAFTMQRTLFIFSSLTYFWCISVFYFCFESDFISEYRNSGEFQGSCGVTWP